MLNQISVLRAPYLHSAFYGYFNGEGEKVKKETCPDCTYVCGILAKTCQRHWKEFEDAAEATIKARHAQPATMEEIARLRELELVASKIYRNRKLCLGDAGELYSLLSRLSSPLTPANNQPAGAGEE